jgi:flagellar FliL protein
MAAQPQAPKPAAKDAKPDPKAAANAKAEKPPRSKKLLLMALIVLVLVAGGGGAAFVFMSGDESEEHADAQAPEQPSIFVPLETFTVNLLPSDGVQQYLQTNVTLKLTSQTTADTLKTRMPEVRNRILMILSAKRPAELLPATGKQKLAGEIGEAVHGMMARPKPTAAAAPADATAASTANGAGANGNDARALPVEVLFTAFIIQ